MEFAIEPLRGIGPVSFGDTRMEVDAAMLAIGGGMPVSRSAETSCYFKNSFQVSFDDDGHVEFIELASSEDLVLLFHGQDMFDLPADELLTFLRNYETEDASLSNPPYDYLFSGMILTLWDADEQYDYRREGQRPIFGAIGLGNPNYLAAIREIKGKAASRSKPADEEDDEEEDDFESDADSSDEDDDDDTPFTPPPFERDESPLTTEEQEQIRRCFDTPSWGGNHRFLMWCEKTDESIEPMMWTPETPDEWRRATRFYEAASRRSWRTPEDLAALLQAPGPWLIRWTFVGTFMFLNTDDEAILFGKDDADYFTRDPAEAVEVSSERAAELVLRLMKEGELDDSDIYYEPVVRDRALHDVRFDPSRP